jgi:hypothetical protein
MAEKERQMNSVTRRIEKLEAQVPKPAQFRGILHIHQREDWEQQLADFETEYGRPFDPKRDISVEYVESDGNGRPKDREV